MWNSVPDIRSDEQRVADAEIAHGSRDEPQFLARARQDVEAYIADYFDAIEQVNNLPVMPCPGCEVRELRNRDRFAEASLVAITGKIRQSQRAKRAHLRLVADSVQLVLAVA